MSDRDRKNRVDRSHARYSNMQRQIGIAFDCLIQGLQGGKQGGPDIVCDEIAVDDLLGAKIKLERYQILSWTRLDVGLLLRRQFCLELRND